MNNETMRNNLLKAIDNFEADFQILSKSTKEKLKKIINKQFGIGFDYKNICPKCEFATEYINAFDIKQPPNEFSYCLKRPNAEFDKLLEINPETGKQKLMDEIDRLHPLEPMDDGEGEYRGSLPFFYPKFDKNNVNIGEVEPKPFILCSKVLECNLFKERNKK